jgi:hypothetical protein
MRYLSIVRRTGYGARWEIRECLAGGREELAASGDDDTWDEAERQAARWVAKRAFEEKHGPDRPRLLEGFGLV